MGHCCCANKVCVNAFEPLRPLGKSNLYLKNQQLKN
jgi:hypothetical protein